MKKLIVLACLASTVAITSGTAMADSIKGRLGVTGKIGVLIPADNDSGFRNNKTDAGFVGGAGLIYGIDDHFAAEALVTHTGFDSDDGDFDTTDFSLGGQYRFALANQQLVPFVGGGVDLLVNDYQYGDVDTTVGAHANAGIDLFLTRQLALTAEARLLVAPDADITNRDGSRRGDFDPSSVSSTVGLRYFFN